MLALRIPVTLFVACANDMHRKPRPWLWSIVPELTGNEDCAIDVAQSLVVGDAAGRSADFSDSDAHWAMIVGIKVHTPEVSFKGETPEPLGHKFYPEWHLTGTERQSGEQGGLLVRLAWIREHVRLTLVVSEDGAVSIKINDRPCWPSRRRKVYLLPRCASRLWICTTRRTTIQLSASFHPCGRPDNISKNPSISNTCIYDTSRLPQELLKSD